MGDVVRTSSDSMLGQIRLAWWRERLEELDAGAPPPAEPRLKAAACHLLPIGIRGADLAKLEEGWLAIFEPFPWAEVTANGMAERGKLLFGLGGMILARQGGPPSDSGRIWAIVDCARHCSDDTSRSMLLGYAKRLSAQLPSHRIPPDFRPLSMLASLALRDLARGEPFEREGAPGRIAAMLVHRFAGKLPKLG